MVLHVLPGWQILPTIVFLHYSLLNTKPNPKIVVDKNEFDFRNQLLELIILTYQTKNNFWPKNIFLGPQLVKKFPKKIFFRKSIILVSFHVYKTFLHNFYSCHFLIGTIFDHFTYTESVLLLGSSSEKKIYILLIFL